MPNTNTGRQHRRRTSDGAGVVAVVAILLGFGAVHPQFVAGSDAGSDYVFQLGTRAPLLAASVSVLQGTRNADGSCHYDYPEVSVPDDAAAIEVRDVGIDQGRCRKLIEQGIPTEAPGELLEGERRSAATFDDPEPNRPAEGLFATTSTASGYNWTWWEDILGIKMTQDRTNISWSYNGSCALTGSTSGEWTWAWGTGWAKDSSSGSEYESCGYYRGSTASTFSNSWFCDPLPTVYTYYYFVYAYGEEDGSISGSRSTDSVNECAPFWMHYQVQKVT